MTSNFEGRKRNLTNYQKYKKTVDNLKWEWYHNQAVSENNAKQRRFHQIRKKFENK